MNNKTFTLIIFPALLILSLLFWNRMFDRGSDPGASEVTSASVSVAGVPELTMYRSEGCNCCIKWVDHLKASGIEVRDIMVDNMLEIKSGHGVSSDLASCHTAVIDGYVVEGHVPATEILRLIEEQPEATGIAVPGMPIGSPGMEGAYSQSYQVILFDDLGESQKVYAQY